MASWSSPPANNFSGGLIVTDGTLAIGTSQAAALGATTNAVQVNGDLAVLDLNGNSPTVGVSPSRTAALSAPAAVPPARPPVIRS